MPTAFKQITDSAISITGTNLSQTGVTSLALTTGTGALFPQPGNGFWVTLWNGILYPTNPNLDPNMEKVLCTGRTGDTLTINATQKAHTSPCTVALLNVSQNITDIQTAVNAAETNIASNSTAIAGNTSTITTEVARATAAEATKTAALVKSTVQTANFTAVVSMLIPVDTTSGNVTATLPPAPADKSQIAIKMVVQSGLNAVSIVCGGSDVFNKTGGGTTLTLAMLNQGVLLQYSSSLGGWMVVSDDLPLGQLDNRYTNVYNVKAFKAVGDGKYVTDGAITSGQAVLTSASASFTSADQGKTVSVKGASNTGTNTLNTTILSVSNATTIVLAANATLTVTSAETTYGTDDYTAIQNAITAASNAGGGRVYFPQGVYLISAGLLVTGQNVHLQGAGWSLPHPGETNAVMLGTALSSIRPMANFPANTYALTFNNVNNMIIGNSLSDIAFDGRAIKTANNVGCLHYANAAFNTSERFVITDFSGNSILIDEANNIYSIPSVSQMWFDNFTIMNGGSHGIVFGDGNFASDFYISRAWIWGFGSGHGIHLGNSSGQQATLISDSTIGACTIGLWIGSFEVIAHDLFIQASHSHGIYINNPHNNLYFTRIHDNIIRDSDSNLDGSSDIYIATGSYNTILSSNICEKVGNNCGENGITVVDGFGVNGNYVEQSNFSTRHSASNFKNGTTAWQDVRYPGTVPGLTINNQNNSNINTLNITQNDTTNNPSAVVINQYANNAALSLTAYGTTGGGNVTTGLRITAPNQTSGNMVQIYNSNNGYLAGGFRGMFAVENGASASTIDALVVIQNGTGKAIAVYNGYGSKSFTVDKAGNVGLADAANISIGTTTGTIIGTATNQKLGFFNVTPVVQQTGDILTALSNLGLVASPSLAAGDIPTLNQNTTGNAATVTTNANLTGPITSVGNATSVASQTGTGSKFVMDTSPTLVTPALGAATGTSLILTGTSANILAAGANGSTNPVLVVNANTISVATGISIIGAAAGAGIAIAAISSGTNENMTVDAKGTGKLTLGSVSTGGVTIGSNSASSGLVLNVANGNTWLTLQQAGSSHLTVATSGGTDTWNFQGQSVWLYNALHLGVGSGQSNAFVVNGSNSFTNPTFSVDCSAGSIATGVKIKGNAAGSGAAIAVMSSASNENGTLDALGTGTFTINGTATGNITLGSTSNLVNFGQNTTAVGGGSSATLSTIGGSGPATAAQNSWLKININGTASFVPIWR